MTFKARFISVDRHAILDTAMTHAEKLLDEGSELLKAIYAKNDWKYGESLGQLVVFKILNCDSIAEVRFYRSFNPWSRVVGYAKGGKIYINERKASDYKTIVGNLVHEYMHVVGFTHGNNYKTKDKCLYSVPYFASEWIRENL